MKPTPLLALALVSTLCLPLAVAAQAPPSQTDAEAALARDKAQLAALQAQTEATLAQRSATAATAKANADAKYQAGLDFINTAQWDQALAAMKQAQAELGNAGDGAMYWQAYADAKLGRANEALERLRELQSAFPDSGWKEDVEALALQMRQASGQQVSPSTQPNDDLKLLAINGLMQSDPAQALPLLEKVIQGSSSTAVKQRALFVLAQNHSAQATDDLLRVAQAPGDPALGMDAVRYLGMMGGDSGRAGLAKVYASSTDAALKGSILRSYMIGGDRARLLAAAKGETNPVLQQEAIRNLGLAGGKDELWQLYQTNPPKQSKSDIIRSLGLAGDLDHLIPLAQSEKDPDLRSDAIRSLGLSGSPKAQDALVAMYTGAQDRANSQAIIRALFIHNSAAALVGLARKENDPDLKRSLVREISLMHSPVATQYLMEILNQ